jgi:alpha-glucosidase
MHSTQTNVSLPLVVHIHLVYHVLVPLYGLGNPALQTNHKLILSFMSIQWSFLLYYSDVPVQWDALRNTPTYLLNWALAGVGYTTVDIGGFSGGDTPTDLLIRWYQVGVFMSLMRVHSSLDNKPHWPFLYGDDAARSMRIAMNLRYQLVPTIYSLAHEQYSSGKPIFRPLFMEWPQDQSVAHLTSQWLLGSGIMAAPVLSQDNNVQVYLPAALWYEFNSTVTHPGPSTLSLSNVPMDNIPIYVRAGTIIPLAPVVQYTDALPGGALLVQVYAGVNGIFTMIEDDGETKAYESGVKRSTTFRWLDNQNTLAWTVQGSFADAHTFTSLQVTGFFANGKKVSNIVAIGTSGSITF